ncbi:MAG TPA: type I-U CRISPR-associated RAMP protein Csb1/Cas7u [Candidatus Binataceae bacterium]|jgi:CRISPR-associated protein Csb1|nr:type I-U CRISPR-associated RAMP protein Csb1/Cas7u [Candidatus Binataceae bacterium]
MFDQLNDVPRLLMHADLKPVQGDRFQPTGFADLGAAVYERPDGKRMLLVESAQSMANRFEHTCLDGDGPDIAPELRGVPYVLARLLGSAAGKTGDRAIDTKTSSLVEAHRLNSPFIISNESFRRQFIERAAYSVGKPIDWGRVASAVFFFDPNALLHGVFMANLEDGRIKIPRMLSSFIEAEDAREVLSGGVKNNPIDPTGTIRSINLYDKDVYSNVPYHRTEFTAARTIAYFNLDLALLRGYGLGSSPTELLIALALYKIRRLLFGGLRLRTACDLTLQNELVIDNPTAFVMPPAEALLDAIRKNIDECSRQGLFANPPVTELTTEVKTKNKAMTKQAVEELADEADEE